MSSTRWMCAAGVVALTATILTAPAVPAGTIITTNLTAGSTIVNIDARADGSATYSQPNPPQAFWYQPTASAPSLIVQPGTYTFRIINPTDASALYPNLTSAQLGQIYTAWTYNSPWSENYLVFKSTALTNPSESQLFDGAIAPGSDPAQLTFASAAAAYSGTVANGYYNKIRPAPPGRDGGANSYLTSFTFAQPTTLLFVIPDNILSDNTGGVSVVIQSTAAVPEPSGLLLFGLGSAGLVAVGWRRRAAG